MKVTLIRHTAVDVPKGVCYGQTDVPLKETFEEEATVTSGNLSNETFDKVFVSPLSRCVRLAEYCGYGDATRDDRLKEINFGEWEMQRFMDIKDPMLQEWFRDYMNVPAKGGESFVMLQKRVSEFLDELKQQDYQHVAIFAHGGVLMCAEIYAGKINPEEAFGNLTPYGGIVQIEI